MVGQILIVVFVIIVLIIVAVVSFLAIKKGNNNFETNKIDGTAIIVGHSADSTSSNIEYMVKVLNSNDENSYNLKGVYNVKKANGQLDTAYPHFDIGDEVYVQYAPKKVAGIKVLDVRINRNVYDYPN